MSLSERNPMITTEIAGYTYNTENKCVDCTRKWVVTQLRTDLGGAWFGFEGSTTEELLHTLAGIHEIDRDYADSNDFPVPFSGQQALTDQARAAFDGENDPVCSCGTSFTE